MTMTCCANVAKTLKMCWVKSIWQSRTVSLKMSMTKKMLFTPFKRPSERFIFGSRILVNQDAARTDFIDRLNKSSVLFIQDWAMKFLPRQYRESQGGWFARKGFSWHITVAIRKKKSEMETQAFMHVVEQCNQDSPCVVMLMEHLLATLKKENPDINRAFYRQDNPGCYHAANTILACRHQRENWRLRWTFGLFWPPGTKRTLRSICCNHEKPCTCLNRRGQWRQYNFRI